MSLERLQEPSCLALLIASPGAHVPLALPEVERRWQAAGGGPLRALPLETAGCLWSAVGDGPDPDPGVYVLSLWQLEPEWITRIDLVAPITLREVVTSRATHLLELDTLLPPGGMQTREGLHRHLQRLHALGDARSVGWMDGSLQLLSDLSTLEDLAEAPICPSLEQSVLILRSAASDSTRAPLLTRGLRRLGLPEVETPALAPDLADLASIVLVALTDSWVVQGLPAPLEPFNVTWPSLDLRWLPGHTVRALLPSAECSTTSPSPGLVPDGSAMLLSFPPGGPEPGDTMQDLLGLLEVRLAELETLDLTVLLSDQETERQSLLALHHLPTFLELARRLAGRQGWSCLAKVGLREEHLWFTVLQVAGPDRVVARLLSRPVQGVDVTPGQTLELNLRKGLSDWCVTGPEELHVDPRRPHLVRQLLQQLRAG